MVSTEWDKEGRGLDGRRAHLELGRGTSGDVGADGDALWADIVARLVYVRDGCQFKCLPARRRQGMNTGKRVDGGQQHSCSLVGYMASSVGYLRAAHLGRYTNGSRDTPNALFLIIPDQR